MGLLALNPFFGLNCPDLPLLIKISKVAEKTFYNPPNENPNKAKFNQNIKKKKDSNQPYRRLFEGLA